MATFRYDLMGVGSTLEFSPNGGQIVWNVDHFESTSDGSTLAQMRVPTTPVVGNDAASKAYVDMVATIPTQPFYVSFYYPGQQDVNQELIEFVSPIAVTFPDDFTGSVGYVETNPTLTYTLSIERDGVAIGQVDIDNAGAFTFSTIGAGTEIFNPGQRLTIRAPGLLDATILNIAITFSGTR